MIINRCSPDNGVIITVDASLHHVVQINGFRIEVESMELSTAWDSVMEVQFTVKDPHPFSIKEGTGIWLGEWKVPNVIGVACSLCLDHSMELDILMRANEVRSTYG